VPQPLLSIVTPSLNQGRYIGQCLESVAAEMASPIAREMGVEHIVMDGGSTDETVRLLENATHIVHWQSAPDGGQSAAINRGLLDHATGRYATWLNADDWFEPGALGPMLERLVCDDAPDVLVGRCRFVEGDRTIFSPKPPEPIDMASLLRLRTKWFAGELIVQPEAFFDRGLFERIGGLNEANHFTMDHELWLKLLEAGARFEAIDHGVACMRVHPQQKTADNRRIVESLIRFGRPFLDRLGEPGGVARSEIASLERKLALSDPVLRRLRLPWAGLEPIGDAQQAHAAGPGEFHLSPLRAVLDGVPKGPGVLGRRYQTRVLGDGPISDIPLRLKPRTEPPFDAVLFWHTLSRAQDPAHALREAIAGLRAGGFVVAAAELASCESGLAQYTQGLAGLINQQLSQDHDWLIDHAAMPWVSSMDGATVEDDARWLAAHPHPSGVDLETLMAEAGLERVASMRYGGMSWHPLTPFAAVEGVPGREHDAWCCGVWRKR
jgi:hypothetical protein